MQEESALARCSVCGTREPRGDMFGAEPDLLCDACAERIRQRMAPSATGRIMSAVISGPTPATIGVLLAAAVIFVGGRLWHGNPTLWAPWISFLTNVGPTADGGIVSVTAQPWRLVSSAFLHAGIFHIIFNAWWIWDLGRAIEAGRGWLAMGLLVVGSAVTASAAQWIFAGGEAGLPYWPGGVGLSGVVYALAAFLFTQRKSDPIAATIMNPRTTRFLAAWLVICVVLTEMGTLRIGNWAHGAGAAWGLAAGFANRSRYRHALWGLLALATVAIVYAVMQGARTW